MPSGEYPVAANDQPQDKEYKEYELKAHATVGKFFNVLILAPTVSNTYVSTVEQRLKETGTTKHNQKNGNHVLAWTTVNVDRAYKNLTNYI